MTATLEDLVSSLQSALAKAVATSDAATAAVAAAYAGDPALSYLPVPYVRLLNVSVRFSIAISDVQAQSRFSRFVNLVLQILRDLVQSAFLESWAPNGVIESLLASREAQITEDILALLGSSAPPGRLSLVDPIVDAASRHLSEIAQAGFDQTEKARATDGPPATPSFLRASLKRQMTADIRSALDGEAFNQENQAEPGQAVRFFVTASELAPVAPAAIGSVTVELAVDRAPDKPIPISITDGGSGPR